MKENSFPFRAEDNSDDSVAGDAIGRKIELERAQKESAQADAKRIKEARRALKAEMLAEAAGGPIKLFAEHPLILAAVAAVVIVALMQIIPALTPAPRNEYFSESDLEKVVGISKLSTVDYVYNGIAERVPDNVSVLDFTLVEYGGYRIKYKAHVPVSFDMSQIVFEIDNEAKVVTAFLPDPKVEDPRLDGEKLDYLPDSVVGDLREDLELCKADARAEVPRESEIKERAFENLKSTIEALTMPVIDGYELEFEYLEEQAVEEGDDAE